MPKSKSPNKQQQITAPKALKELFGNYKSSIDKYVKVKIQNKKTTDSWNTLQTNAHQLLAKINETKGKDSANAELLRVSQELETFINAISNSKIKEQQQKKFGIKEEVASTNIEPTTKETTETNNGAAAA